MRIQGDFHVHSNFCPHGTTDKMEDYVLAAIEKGLQYISFTEHAPLPKAFNDPSPAGDSCMNPDLAEDYFREGERLKAKYANQIKVTVGFEVDYLIGYEQETTALLNQWGGYLEDAILSVHMLQTPTDEYVCLDYSPEEFNNIIKAFGSTDSVYENYYQTLLSAVKADLGPFKPRRIGHITLIEKFHQRFPVQRSFKQEIQTVLRNMAKYKLEIDVNASGYFKQYCQKSYPGTDIIKEANKLGIPLVPGSDSHERNHLTRGFYRLPALEYALPGGLQTK
ncbi:histidinol-phosphatase HisJ [Sediminibacillus albus]|uniref:Histidinol-phosphatase n=1 Tax=Sediminibacillus albus TaxID=407036 RepID=A0A1G8VUN8_9BACI|nr:histidinol-phosphatase HisJ [Sediminibacillus albus]SDJ69831.1 histidinol-phosphatase (PHP family) [Sediminibacillus albus]